MFIYHCYHIFYVPFINFFTYIIAFGTLKYSYTKKVRLLKGNLWSYLFNSRDIILKSSKGFTDIVTCSYSIKNDYILI